MNTARVFKLGKLDVDNEDSIQKGIPIPPQRCGPPSKYKTRMALLEIGDSFFVSRGTRQGAIHHAHALGIRIVTRSMGKGIRIWRTA